LRSAPDFSLAALCAALVPLAWLLPNHYLPWMSAWLEGLAFAFLALAVLMLRRPARVPVPVLAFCGVAAASVLLQWAGGRMSFGGDVVIVLLYLAGFALAVALGSALDSGGRFAELDLVAAGLLIGALACAAMALTQWLRPGADGFWLMVLPPGQRPYANLGQPNLLCSVLFVGVCAAALLRERGLLPTGGLLACWLVLVGGMVMTGSRTAALQLALLPLLALALQRRAGLAVRPAIAALPVAAGLLLWLAWPAANEALQLSGSRPLAEQMAPGVRLPYWRAMAAAVAAEPLAGYGWQQVAAALWRVALDVPPVQRAFEQSHNLVLDLVLWAGVPVGLLLAALLAWCVARPLRRLRDGVALWALAAVLGLLLHAMLEYPLHFAYLLVPAGLLLGVAVGRTEPPVARRPALRIAGLAFGVVLALVARDVLEAEQNQRTLLLELARVGTVRVESPPPDLRVLSQLQAFLTFVRTDPRAGMADADLETMRRVATRFPYAPSLGRYAQALALNGRPDEAQRTLRVLCAMHVPERCRAARERWDAARAEDPRLPAWP